MRALRHAPILARIALFTILALLAVGGLTWWLARPPAPDDFYRMSIPADAAPGTLLRHEPYDVDVPAHAQGWRILYVTQRHGGRNALASAVVVADRTTRQSPRPVVAWAHGTVGLEPGCAPSMSKPFANVPAFDALLARSWVYVATDYPGLGTDGGHPYLIGQDAAMAVFDAVRAARQLQTIRLQSSIVIWGHSQGGNTSLWAGILARERAPDIDVRGIAALAPASDLTALIGSAKTTMFGKIVSAYLIHAYAAAYTDVAVSDYVHPAVQPIVSNLAARCVGGWPTLVSAAVTTLLPANGIFARDPTAGPLGDRLRQNSPLGAVGVPVFVAQGGRDDLVSPQVQQTFVEAFQRFGNRVAYQVYADRDHVSLVASGSPLEHDILAWTAERFDAR